MCSINPSGPGGSGSGSGSSGMSSNNRVPMIGWMAPKFSGKAVLGDKFVDVKLEDYAGKYLVLFFYPMDFTHVCPTEIRAFNEKVEEFEKLEARIVACSTDSAYAHLAWSKLPPPDGLGIMKYPILADPNHNISRSYGVLKESEGVSVRGTFIIDRVGKIRHVSVNDESIGRNADETYRQMAAMKFLENNTGKMCPASWKPGDAGFKPKSNYGGKNARGDAGDK